MGVGGTSVLNADQIRRDFAHNAILFGSVRIRFGVDGTASILS